MGGTWTSGRESVDGTLQPQSSPHDAFTHPVTAQEAQGHGLKAYQQFAINGDGLVLYPSTVAEAPSDGNDVRYKLVDIFASGEAGVRVLHDPRWRLAQLHQQPVRRRFRGPRTAPPTVD
ncbi:hypothetical protein O7635_19100 [Asanoa sp. WMMD1127]|uniref:hypothetical protein n=1 Tax=Asanoa sp. WMMD1127 TaxID=3016107 RepID=UPI002418017D|nr:hypothetical protein [Asanoa sp. WMMD1127]MDG4823970.1 hypothetical protein [Asanoa sp. WMMD1127]